MQLKRRISQRIGHAVLAELRANGANNDSLWLRPLNNESSNHHVVGGLDKGACADITQDRRGYSIKLKCANVRHSRAAISALVVGWRSRVTAVDSRAAGL